MCGVKRRPGLDVERSCARWGSPLESALAHDQSTSTDFYVAGRPMRRCGYETATASPTSRSGATSGFTLRPPQAFASWGTQSAANIRICSSVS